MTMALCLTGAMCAPTQAAQVVFLGTASQSFLLGGGSFAFANGTPVYLSVGFTPGPAATAAITSAQLEIGASVFSGLNITGGLVTVGQAGPNDTVTVTLPNAGGSSGPVLWNGLGASGLTFTSVGVNGGVDAGTTNAWQAIYDAGANISNSVVGSFALSDGVNLQIYNFAGAAVPEPGSMALLSGLGLVFGAAARRRRNARKSAV
ncbi:MAG: PEP-CTERM sorting domain-containing protein [Planctomycetaceae bacterium]